MADELLRVVGHQPDLASARGRRGSGRRCRSRAGRPGSRARGWPRPCRGPVLQRVRAQLVRRARCRAPPAHVEEHAASLGRDLRQRRVELLAAVAAQRAEDVAGEALGVDAHEDGLGPSTSPMTRATCSAPSRVVSERDARNSPYSVGSADRDAALTSFSCAAAVVDQVGDRDHLEAVPLAEGHEVGHARHRAVLVHDLADDAGRVRPGEPREIDRASVWPARTRTPPSCARSGKMCPGRTRSSRLRRRVDRDLDGAARSRGRDAGRDAVARLDGDA